MTISTPNKVMPVSTSFGELDRYATVSCTQVSRSCRVGQVVTVLVQCLIAVKAGDSSALSHTHRQHERRQRTEMDGTHFTSAEL